MRKGQHLSSSFCTKAGLATGIAAALSSAAAACAERWIFACRLLLVSPLPDVSAAKTQVYNQEVGGARTYREDAVQTNALRAVYADDISDAQRHNTASSIKFREPVQHSNGVSVVYV